MSTMSITTPIRSSRGNPVAFACARCGLQSAFNRRHCPACDRDSRSHP